MLHSRQNRDASSPTVAALLVLAVMASGLVFGAGCGAAQTDPKKSETRYGIAVELFRNAKYDQAELEASRALKHDPKNAQAHNLLGLVDFISAVNNLSLIEVSNCLTGVDAEGLRLEMDEKLKAAAAHFETAIQLDAEYGEALQNRGLVQMTLEDYAGAIKLYEAALQHPTRVRDASLTRANLGWAYFHRKQSGDDVRAAKEILQSLQFKPGMCLGRYRLARIYHSRGENDKALAKFRDVVADIECQKASPTLKQEASYYVAKNLAQNPEAEPAAGNTGAKIPMADLGAAVQSCTEQLSKSCLANECRALLADNPRSGRSLPQPATANQ